MGMMVMSQWQIWDQAGSEREGASGSVRARTSWVYSRVAISTSEDGGRDGEAMVASSSCTLGAFCKREGDTVLPTSAVAFSQKIARVYLGSKALRTVGMISAFLSLKTL